jgi:DNA-binding NarL/FixJ family response regulator
VDDHPLVREWLANVINQQSDLTVCGESEGRENCVETIQKKKPHVAIVDISLKDCSGLDLIAEIKQRTPQVEIIVLSMHSSPLYARQALRAGASGYVVKRETTKQICQAIREVIQGGVYVSKEISLSSQPATQEDNFDLTLLSERELEVFQYLGQGSPTRQIAIDLGISIKTVQVHCGNIREKLGLPGATELYSAAVRWNERHGGNNEWEFALVLDRDRQESVQHFAVPKLISFSEEIGKNAESSPRADLRRLECPW